MKAPTFLVDDLQLQTRLVSGTLLLNRARIDLTELAHESMEIVRPLAETRGVKLLLEAPERVMAGVDGSQLACVIRNLLNNALRHAPDGSVVLMHVARSDINVVLLVHDEGTGFPTEFRERAFDPFIRADSARNMRTGTAGLGLSIARAAMCASCSRLPPADRIMTPDSTVRSPCGSRRDEAVDQRVGVRREARTLPVPPERARSAHTRRQFDLHPLLAR